jgi:predicted HTH domain antitoxin
MANTATLQIALPADFIALLGAQPQAAATAREYIILGLFQEDRISGGKAAELLGLTRLGFIALLARKGIPYFRLTPDEWAKEVAIVKTWSTNRA